MTVTPRGVSVPRPPARHLRSRKEETPGRFCLTYGQPGPGVNSYDTLPQLRDGEPVR